MKSLKLTNLSESELNNSELANSKGGTSTTKGIDDFFKPLTGFADPGDLDPNPNPFGPKFPWEN